MPVPLNDHQARHLWATCQYIARQLSDLEAIVATSAPESPFARYLDDVTPAQKARLGEDCARMHAEMARVLASLGIAAGAPPVSARHSMRAAFNFIEVALEELKPGHMKHYGPVPSEVAPALDGLVRDLQAAVQRLEQALGDAPEALAGEATAAPVIAAPLVNTRVLSRADADALESDFHKTAGVVEDVRLVLEKLRAPVDAVVFEALEHAADRASRLMDSSAADAAAVDRAVCEGVAEVGVERAEDVRRALANLIARVQTTRRAAAQTLALPDPATPADWGVLMRHIPAFVVPDLHVELRLFLRRAFGAGAAHTRARRAIETQIGATITELVTAQSTQLFEWSMRLWARVSDDLAAETDRYRTYYS